MEANDLQSSQQSQLNELLIKNKELFVTKENPKLGLTNLVEHQIHLKPLYNTAQTLSTLGDI
jgi:hypothetical protein